jgi:hypothetical protein
MTGHAGMRPLILVRGFGGADVSEEKASPYQGFNDGTVYPTRRGENYIYEGLLLRALKSGQYRYRDATNVAGYYPHEMHAPPERQLQGLNPDAASGNVVLDPSMAAQVLGSAGTAGTVWVYRYYDLAPRSMATYGAGLKRLVELIESQSGDEFDGVDIIAHSMGGLVVGEGLACMHKENPESAKRLVNKVVTLGTPHRGIAFQRAPGWLLKILPPTDDASGELASFDPSSTDFLKWQDLIEPEQVLTVVGTNYRSYGVTGSAAINRLSNLLDGTDLSYNRSDGLVKQSSAQLPGSPRTFIHKCHGGGDSLVTSREAYEIAMRFLHGSHKISLHLNQAKVRRGHDWFGSSEFYLGLSIKPRNVDFALFEQSAEAENCYGPFRNDELHFDRKHATLEAELTEPLSTKGDSTTGWAGADRLLWQGWVDQSAKLERAQGLVFRLDVYVGERDTYGIGFSDDVVFRKQYYLQLFPDEGELFVHTGQEYLARSKSPASDEQQDLDPPGLNELPGLARESADDVLQQAQPLDPRRPGQGSRWEFNVVGTGFAGTLGLEVEPAK